MQIEKILGDKDYDKDRCRSVVFHISKSEAHVLLAKLALALAPRLAITVATEQELLLQDYNGALNLSPVNGTAVTLLLDVGEWG